MSHLVPAGRHARSGLTAVDAAAMLSVLGIVAFPGDEFPCPLHRLLPAPAAARSHADTRLSVVDPHTLRLEALYVGPPKPYWSLAEVLASTTAGRPVDLTGHTIQHVRWWSRLRHSAGLISLDVPQLVLPPLPGHAVALAEGFALLSTLDSERHPGDAVAFSRRFAAEWCGLSLASAHRGLVALQAAGVLVPGDPLPSRRTTRRGPRRRPTQTFRLSPGALIASSTSTQEFAYA